MNCALSKMENGEFLTENELFNRKTTVGNEIPQTAIYAEIHGVLSYLQSSAINYPFKSLIMEFVACNISLFMCCVHLSGNKQPTISISMHNFTI